ncbi:hypothetical protein SRHO_G00275780 [Serrasalmus rhombeus]
MVCKLVIGTCVAALMANTLSKLPSVARSQVVGTCVAILMANTLSMLVSMLPASTVGSLVVDTHVTGVISMLLFRSETRVVSLMKIVLCLMSLLSWRGWQYIELLFWSKTRELMHSYAAVTGRFWTLEDTLVGFMFNDLVWCGQQERDRDFDFQSCPDWSACVSHPVYSLWNRASLNFAAAACGNITVLLNGSIGNAFNRKSMFGSVELDNLNPRMVNHVHIKVIPNLEGPFVESCSKGSILELISVLESRGFRWSCTDRDVTLMILQCMKNPKQSSCQSCSSSLLHRKSLHL